MELNISTDVLLKRCPHFDLLDEIYGDRLKVNPPFVMDSANDDPFSEPCGIHQGNPETISAEDSTKDVPESQPLTTDTSPSTKSHSKGKISERKKRRIEANTGTKALSDLVQIKFDMHDAELTFNKEKWEHEKRRLDETYLMEQQKFDFEKEMQLKRLALEEKVQQDKVDIEKYRIEQEMKLKLEIAKLERNQEK